MGTSRGLVAVEGRIAPWGPRVEPPNGQRLRSTGQSPWTTRTDLHARSGRVFRTQDPSPRTGGRAGLHVESEVDDLAVLDEVFLALETQERPSPGRR